MSKSQPKEPPGFSFEVARKMVCEISRAVLLSSQQPVAILVSARSLSWMSGLARIRNLALCLKPTAVTTIKGIPLQLVDGIRDDCFLLEGRDGVLSYYALEKRDVAQPA